MMGETMIQCGFETLCSNMKPLLILSCVALLGGCATSKPPLPEDRYVELAQNWLGINACGETGKIDAATASLGKTYVENEINRFNWDEVKFNTTQERYKNLNASQEYCNKAAMSIHALSNKFRAANSTPAAPSIPTPTYRPTQTYCNKIGTQTLCSTY